MGEDDIRSELLGENRAMHREVSDIFFRMGLSYKFTTVLEGKDSQVPVVHFAFSKPTKNKPVPEVAVTADLRPLGKAPDGVTRYSFVVEGQRHKRTLRLDPNDVTGKELNEQLIDKVFEQKASVRRCLLAS